MASLNQDLKGYHSEMSVPLTLVSVILSTSIRKLNIATGFMCYYWAFFSWKIKLNAINFLKNIIYCLYNYARRDVRGHFVWPMLETQDVRVVLVDTY